MVVIFKFIKRSFPLQIIYLRVAYSYDGESNNKNIQWTELVGIKLNSNGKLHFVGSIFVADYCAKFEITLNVILEILKTFNVNHQSNQYKISEPEPINAPLHKQFWPIWILVIKNIDVTMSESSP